MAATINGDKAQLEKDVKITLNLLRLCKKKKVSKFIFSSSYLADPCYKSEYGLSKRKAENAVINSNLNCTILRISQIYGKNDKRNISKMVSMVRKSRFIILNKRMMLQPVFVDDVVNIIINSLNLKKKGTYNVAGDEVMSFDTVFIRISKYLNKKIIKINIPLFILYAAIYFVNLFMKEPYIALEQINNLKNFKRIDNTETKNVFGMKFTPFADGLKSII